VAAALKRPFTGGHASAGLVSCVVLFKYTHHLPLYRQEQMSARWGQVAGHFNFQMDSRHDKTVVNGCDPSSRGMVVIPADL
jgi:transposase